MDGWSGCRRGRRVDTYAKMGERQMEVETFEGPMIRNIFLYSNL